MNRSPNQSSHHTSEVELTAPLDYGYETRVLRFAQFQDKADPEGVLRRGLVEEIAEIGDVSSEDAEERTKEIGDVLWYLYAIPYQRATSLTDIIGMTDDLDDAYEKKKSIPQLPIVNPTTGELYDRTESLDSRQAALTCDVLRLVDALNPKTPEVWEGVDSEAQGNIEHALEQAFISLGQYAEAYDISLDDAIGATLAKLESRPRNPHVIDEKDVTKVDSVRERIRGSFSKAMVKAALGRVVTEASSALLTDDERKLLP